jgi:hypothetical protein
MKVNTQTRELTDTNLNQLSWSDRPNIVYGTDGVLELDLAKSDGTPLVCAETDTWEMYADTDYIHTADSGTLAADYSGAVMQIQVSGLSEEPLPEGFLMLENSAGETDRVQYSAFSETGGVYTFTVDDTLNYSYLANDDCGIEDQLVLYADNDAFNNSADRSDVDVTTGKICVRYDSTTYGHLYKVLNKNTKIHVEIWRYQAGQTRPEKLLQDDIYASPSVAINEGAPAANNPEYLNAAQVNALLKAGYELQFSIDGSTLWHDTQATEDLYWRYRYPGGVWSDGIAMVIGPKGDAAPAMQIQYSADNADWHSVFAEGDYFIRFSVDAGNSWSSGVQFVGIDGGGSENIITKSITDADLDANGEKVFTWSALAITAAPIMVMLDNDGNDIECPILTNSTAENITINLQAIRDDNGGTLPGTYTLVIYAPADGEGFAQSITDANLDGNKQYIVTWSTLQITGFTVTQVNDNTGLKASIPIQWDTANEQITLDFSAACTANGGTLPGTFLFLGGRSGEYVDVSGKADKDFSSYTEKVALVDADAAVLNDSEDSGSVKRFSLLNLWNFIKGKADAAYSAIVHTHAISDVTDLQTSLDGKQDSLGFTPEDSANKGAVNGYASLGADGKVPSAQLPSISSGKLIVEDSGYGLDNGSTYRGTIGTKSVSLEYSDTIGTFGACGNYSFVGGGYLCAALTNYSFVGGGSGNIIYSNNLPQQYNTICGGYNNKISSANGYDAGTSFIGGGSGNSIDDKCNGTVITGGVGNSAIEDTDNATIPGGFYAKVSKYGEFAIGSGRFSATGDCQRGNAQARVATSAADQTELFLDGTSIRFTLSDGDAYSCRVTVLGKQADGSCGTAVYQVLIKNEGGTTSLTGTLQTIVTWLGDTNIGSPTWAIEADDTNDALSIKITPANTTATRWTALIEYVKINYY